jgi:hypothetical protein
VPAWLSAQWLDRSWAWAGRVDGAVLADGLMLGALAYLAAERPAARSHVRQALAWVGAVALLPLAAAVAFHIERAAPPWWPADAAHGRYVVGWTVAFAAPILVAGLLGGRQGALFLAAAAAWVLAGPAAPLGLIDSSGPWPHLWCAVLALGVIAWGVREASARRVNLGFAGFALAVLWFYSSNVMDRLGRAVSLVGLGVLFLAGGWLLDRVRRRLVTRVQEGA